MLQFGPVYNFAVWQSVNQPFLRTTLTPFSQFENNTISNWLGHLDWLIRCYVTFKLWKLLKNKTKNVLKTGW